MAIRLYASCAETPKFFISAPAVRELSDTSYPSTLFSTRAASVASSSASPVSPVAVFTFIMPAATSFRFSALEDA